MKKLFVFILALCLAVPFCTFAETQDPIVGSWYMLFDKNITPEMAPNFNDLDLIIMAYSFMSDGTIFLSENDIKDKVGDYASAVSGKWEKNGSSYTYSITGFGSGNVFVESDSIYLQTGVNGLYLKLRKMIPYDPYADYSRR